MSWTGQAERGNAFLCRAALALVQRGGWRAGRVLAAAATVWFVLTSHAGRAASRDYLRRVLPRPVRLADVVRHFDSFSCAVLDRVLLLSGGEDGYEIEVEGLPAIREVLDAGRGCILIGAHLGSFEVLRLLARQAPVPVWAMMYRRNAGALTSLLDKLAPSVRARVLEVGDTASMIEARECVARGEMVGFLADRAPPGHRTVPVPFLGGTARLPSGPFVLAALLGAPVFLFFAVRTGTRRYRVTLSPFAEQVVLRRETRHADLTAVVRRYAEALERACRATPLQWFNFFPFWEPDHAEPYPAQPVAVPPVMADARPG